MSSTYTPTPAAGVDPPALTVPAGTDAPNAASVNTPLEQLADWASMWQPNVGAAARVLIRTISNNQTGRKTRFYVNPAGALEVTFNCWWDAANTRWQADNGAVIYNHVANAMRFRLDLTAGAAGFLMDRPLSASATHWSDSSWETTFVTGNAIGWLNTQAGVMGANPIPSTGILNTMPALLACKSQGVVHINSASAVLIDGCNIGDGTNGTTGPSLGGSPHSNVVLTFPSGGVMDDGNYSVKHSLENARGLGSNLVSGRSASSFTIEIFDTSTGALVNLDSFNIMLHFSVHGRQTT